ncbi:MAG: replication factor C large subunit [Methanobacteriota archaeon]|nr:MAG: replication factor C large subunit [Euryarchaeota archaeon]
MPEDWTERYRPASLSEVVGNDRAIGTMRRWAESWKKGAPKKKALVLKGEPGTGKTSAALALANDFGWDVIEMNASDHRNADSIRRVAGLGAVSETFSNAGEFLSTSEGKRKLIVLDEADNLFGREDHGGAKAISQTIKETNQPVILIVNDYYALTRKASAIKTLAVGVKFARHRDGTVLEVLRGICEAEGLTVDAGLLAAIVKNASGDLRGAINDLQMLVEGRKTVDVEGGDALGKRNQGVELDAALEAMYGARTAREARDATNSLDKTPDELIMWIEESIPSEFSNRADRAAAFDALSRSDVYLRRTRRLQHYGLWAYAKEMMTSGVALARSGPRRRSPPRYGFPSYLIMMSRSKSVRSSRAALCRKLSPVLHSSSREIAVSVLPYLSAMARNDSELLAHLGAEAEFDEGDVAYLLGTDPASDAVADTMDVIRRIRSGEIRREAAAEAGSDARRGTRLSDF